MDEGAKLFALFDTILHGHKNSKSEPLEINFTKIYPESVPVHNRISRLKKDLIKVVELVKSCRKDEATFCLLLEAGLPNLIVESIGVFREVSSLEGVAPLLEELLDTVNLISESGAHGQASMVKSICGPYLDLLLGEFCSLSQKTEISRSLNIILETCPFAVKEILLKKSEIIEKLRHLFQLIITVGDYEFQIGLLECMFRLVPRKVRAQYTLKFIQRRFLDQFLDIRDANFETDCRVFLNEVNRTAGNNGRVFSVPCEKAIFGKRKLNKPNDDDYDEFWVDFNYGTRRITLFCEQDVMENNSQMSQGEQDLWETLSVSLGDVKSYSYTEHDNIGISSIELKKDINCLYPNMMQCSGKLFELFVQTKYNPRKALMSVFGSEKCANRKASSAILPLHLNVQNVLYEETESPLCRRSTHEGGVAALQDNSHGSPMKLTPLRTKISVPSIPMSTPARSLCSQEQDQESVSSSRNIQMIQHARTNNERKTTQTYQPSHSKKSTFAAPKTPTVKNVRPKVKTPVVTIRDGTSKKLQKVQKIKQKGKHDTQGTCTQDMSSDAWQDDIIPDSLPMADHQPITTNAALPKCQRNPGLSDSGIDLAEGAVLQRDGDDVLSKDQKEKEKDSSFDFTVDIDNDFKHVDKHVSQGTRKSLKKKKQGNKTDQNISQNCQQMDQADENLMTQSSDRPSSLDENVIQESQYETQIEGSSDVQDTSKNTDCLYSSTVTTKAISGKQKIFAEKQRKLIQPKDKVQNLNIIEEGVSSESSLQCVPGDVTSQLTEAHVRVSRLNTLPSHKDMNDKNAVKNKTTGKDSATKKKNKCKDKNAFAQEVEHKLSGFTTNTEVKRGAEHKKAHGKPPKSKQKVKTSGCHETEEEHTKEPHLLEKHCKRVLPSRKAKAKHSNVYNEEFSSSENVGNLFESPFSMTNDTSKDLPKESSATTKMSLYVKPNSIHRLLSHSGLYFPELSNNSSPASDPYNFDMEYEEQSHSQFETNPAEAMDINLTNKENGIQVTSMNTSKFFKHRSEVGVNVSSETIATNYMKTWHQKLNKKGGKSAVLSQSYTSWKSVDKKSKNAKKESINKKENGENSTSKRNQQNHDEESCICPERRGSKANVVMLKDTEVIQNDSTCSRKKTKNPKFKLFNPDLSVLLPTQNGNAELMHIQEENNDSLLQEKDQLESRTKEQKLKHCDQRLEEEKKTVVADAPKKKKQSSKSRSKGKASEKLDSESSDRYENGTTNTGVIENFAAICESLVDQSSIEIEGLDKVFSKQDEEHKTNLQKKVTKSLDEDYRQDNCSIINDLKSELSWIARQSTAKKKKSQKTYKRKPAMRKRQHRSTDTDSQNENRNDENGDEQSEADVDKDDSEEDNDGGVSDDGDILLIRREAEDLILTQDSDAPTKSANGELTNVSSVIHSAITSNILQRGTPKVHNSKRRYSPLDVRFISTPKTPKTPGSFQWSDGDQAGSETADVALTQQFEVCKEYSLPLKDHESIPKLLSRCADKMVRSGPSSTVRPHRSALKRKYRHLKILDESESDDMLSSESDPHNDDEKSFCPRKLFRKDLPEPAIGNSPIPPDKEENISNRLPSKIAQPLKSCPTPVPPFHLPDQQTEDGSSSQNGELDLLMDLGCDSGINTGISTYIQSFGMDMQKQLKAKHQQLTELTRGALRNTQKHIYKIWTSESHDRGRALEHFKDKMLEELLSLEADVTALKNTEEKSLIFCHEQLEAMKKHRVSQEIRLRNLKLLHSTLDDNFKESEANAQSKQLNLKQIMKKDVAALQRKLLLESNQHQISNVKRCLKSMLF
ncbi:synaptonemal complex protein 2-like [Haliotis asinina]|uniref:synaptonemal complex protein 2-like n=1 Tax=Haliotis asinina TaxID=109174 RepID=UPI00353203CE